MNVLITIHQNVKVVFVIHSTLNECLIFSRGKKMIFNKPLPQVVYDRGKAFMMKHCIIHYFFHNTYCKLQKSNYYIPWSDFKQTHVRYKIGLREN